jgi:hypothetical protein
MIEQDEVIKNAEKYFATADKYGFMTESLQNLLGVDFIAAPASTTTKAFSAYEGGLIKHILCVTKYAVHLNGTLPTKMQVDKASLVKVCLLHQIGKAKLFMGDKPSKWHQDNLGKMYDYNNDLVSMTVGERSTYYCMANEVNLEEDEYQAIVNYSKIDEDDKQSKWHTSTIGKLLRLAVEMAIMEAKHEEA